MEAMKDQMTSMMEGMMSMGRMKEVRGNIHWEEEDTVQGTIVNREPTLSFSFEESYHRVVSKQPLGQPKEDF